MRTAANSDVNRLFYLSLLRFNALDETRLRVGKIDRGQRLEIFQTG